VLRGCPIGYSFDLHVTKLEKPKMPAHRDPSSTRRAARFRARCSDQMAIAGATWIAMLSSRRRAIGTFSHRSLRRMHGATARI